MTAVESVKSYHSLKEKKGTKTVPLGHHFFENSAFSDKRSTILVPMGHQIKVVPPAIQCPFGEWHQNGAPKGTVLRTINQCPRDTVLVPLIFLSVYIIMLF